MSLNPPIAFFTSFILFQVNLVFSCFFYAKIKLKEKLSLIAINVQNKHNNIYKDNSLYHRAMTTQYLTLGGGWECHHHDQIDWMIVPVLVISLACQTSHATESGRLPDIPLWLRNVLRVQQRYGYVTPTCNIK